MTLEPVGRRLVRALIVSMLLLAAALAVGLWVGGERIDFTTLSDDPVARALFFRLRLPRVAMACLVGASLAVTGGAMQALFRNPLAEPYTLGVSGGGALGASVAIALGWSGRVGGTPLIYLASFAGAMAAMFVVRAMARAGASILPGALLLSGVVVNLIASAAVLTIQYISDPSSALRIVRWMVGGLDVVGFGTAGRMAVVLIPGWLALLAFSHALHLLAIDEDTAATLGVHVRRTELFVHVLASLIVAVTVSTGGAIGFVGLLVPHAVRMMFGEDLRIVLPGSLVLGAAFLVLADALARSVLSTGELPVGAITGLLGGPAFLWLLYRRQKFSAM
jgi:cobalamin transport system permease protein